MLPPVCLLPARPGRYRMGASKIDAVHHPPAAHDVVVNQQQVRERVADRAIESDDLVIVERNPGRKRDLHDADTVVLRDARTFDDAVGMRPAAPNLDGQSDFGSRLRERGNELPQLVDFHDMHFAVGAGGVRAVQTGGRIATHQLAHHTGID